MCARVLPLVRRGHGVGLRWCGGSCACKVLFILQNAVQRRLGGHLRQLNKVSESKTTLEQAENDEVTHCVLRAIDEELGQMGASLSDFPQLPIPPPLSNDESTARVLREEIFDKENQEEMVIQLEPLLNPGQAKLCESIYQAVLAAPGTVLSKYFDVLKIFFRRKSCKAVHP